MLARGIVGAQESLYGNVINDGIRTNDWGLLASRVDCFGECVYLACKLHSSKLTGSGEGPLIRLLSSI